MEDEYRTVFSETLEKGPATYLKINAHVSSAADIDKSLTEVYQGNGLQPFWIKGGKPGPRAVDILAVLDDAQSHGLDPALTEAVKRFQKRHSLQPDGVIGSQTLAVMNVPVSDRIEQVIINMERYRWLKRGIDEPLVAVNIAGFEAAAGRPGTFDLTMPVIVGKKYHETPVSATR